MKIFFIDKVMLQACREAPRGVELFNIRLLRELAGMDLELTAMIHPSWIDYIQSGRIEYLHPAKGRASLANLLGKVSRRDFDILLLGNVANRLAGFVLLTRLRRSFRNCVVIAHREPSRRVCWSQRIWPDSVVVAVNQQIARHYERAGLRNTSVSYGITGADAFYQRPKKQEKDIIDFCVLGNLENAWKGADTAIAAFRLLPRPLRVRCRLHLASYHAVPAFEEPNIVPYPWMAAEEIPDFLAEMDVMIVPSRDETVMRETFSQAMVQGMLSGLPIITTALPILTEKLDQGGGIHTADIPEMSSAMQRLAEDAALRARLGGEARKTALARYVWDTSYFVKHFLEPALEPNPST